MSAYDDVITFVKEVIGMTPEEYINKVKKDRWHAVSGGWLGTFVTEEDALVAVELAREEIYKKLFRISLSSNSMDYVKGVGELMDELRKE